MQYKKHEYSLYNVNKT